MRIRDWSSDVCSSDLIHVTPEAARDGALAKLREGDMIRLDGEAGVLEALVDADEWASREAAPNRAPSAHDVGRNLFALNRAMVTAADQLGRESCRARVCQYV